MVPRQHSRRRGVEFFLVGVWLSCTVSTLWFATQPSGELPRFDEWVELIPVLSGGQPLTLEWLWSPLNEHRIPLPRLAYLAAFAVSGGDFRSGACLSVLLLSIVALLLMGFARRCRGSVLSDAFFPMMLLHWGQAQSLVIGILLQFVVAMTLCYLALVLTLAVHRFTPGKGVLLLLLVVAMPLCGLTGVLTAIPWAVWLTAVGAMQLRSAPREGVAFLLMATVALAVVWIYFVDFSWMSLPVWNQATLLRRGLLGRIETMCMILSMGLGWVGRWLWPLSSVCVLLLGAGATWKVVLGFQQDPSNRLRCSAWLTWMGASMLLVGAVGWGRAFVVGEDLWASTRYATLAAPVIVGVYLAAFVSSTPSFGAWMQPLLGLLAFLAFAGPVVGADEYPHALRWVRILRAGDDAFIRAAVNGASSEHLVKMVKQYAGDVRGLPSMEMFRSAGLGPFDLSDLERQRYIGVDADGSDALLESFLGAGWSPGTDGEARWTVGERAVIHFAHVPGTSSRVTMDLRPLEVPVPPECQLVEVELNGNHLATFRLDRQEAVRHIFELPRQLVTRLNSLSLTFASVGCNEVSPRVYLRHLRIE